MDIEGEILSDGSRERESSVPPLPPLPTVRGMDAWREGA